MTEELMREACERIVSGIRKTETEDGVQYQVVTEEFVMGLQEPFELARQWLEDHSKPIGKKAKRIVETDNFGRDYPDERFVNIPLLSESAAKAVAKLINDSVGENSDRFWKVVDLDYVLSPGFEP